MGAQYITPSDVLSGYLLNTAGAPTQNAIVNDTPALQGLCVGISDAVRAFTGREFWITTFNENRRGNGGFALYPRQRPIQSVAVLSVGNNLLSSVGVDTNGAPAVNVGALGYYNDTEGIYLVGGYQFTADPSLHNLPNVYIKYSAGYAAGPLIQTPANFTVPSVNSSVTLTFPSSVTPATLASLFPGSGTYFIPKAGYYSFVSTTGQNVVLTNLGGNPSLGLTIGNALPGALIVAPQNIYDVASFATLQGAIGDAYDAMAYEVAVRFKELGRLGLTSQSMAGQESISGYKVADMMPRTKAALRAFVSTWSFSD